MTRAALMVAIVAAPASAWALCPNCLGQNETLTPTMKLVGVLLLVPPIVALFVVRAIRRAQRSVAESAPASGTGGGAQ